MIKQEANPKVDFFFNKTGSWQKEYALLRAVLLESGLNEELKWGCPCYTLGKGNIVLIHGFKTYCALLFFKGALQKDPKGLFIQQTEQVQSARQIRFTDVEQIKKMHVVLKEYIHEAISVEKSGIKLTLKKTDAYPLPDEFKEKLEAMPLLRKAFEALTPGRQRAYLLYFAAPKLAQTRINRIEKVESQILQGKGLND